MEIDEHVDLAGREVDQRPVSADTTTAARGSMAAASNGTVTSAYPKPLTAWAKAPSSTMPNALSRMTTR